MAARGLNATRRLPGRDSPVTQIQSAPPRASPPDDQRRGAHLRSSGRLAEILLIPVGKEGDMNRDILEGKWKQLKGSVKEKWGELTDDELDKAAGRFDKV